MKNTYQINESAAKIVLAFNTASLGLISRDNMIINEWELASAAGTKPLAFREAITKAYETNWVYIEEAGDDETKIYKKWQSSCKSFNVQLCRTLLKIDEASFRIKAKGQGRKPNPESRTPKKESATVSLERLQTILAANGLTKKQIVAIIEAAGQA